MRKYSALLFAFTIATPVAVLAAQAVQHTPRGTATDVTAAPIEATAKKTASEPVSDQQLRVLNS
jgi:hypothetical protein